MPLRGGHPFSGEEQQGRHLSWKERSPSAKSADSCKRKRDCRVHAPVSSPFMAHILPANFSPLRIRSPLKESRNETGWFAPDYEVGYY